MVSIEPLRLQPIFEPRVWGGERLQPSATEPIGEAWIVYEGSEIAGGPWAGRTLGDLALELGEDLLGTQYARQSDNRFPLLVKLLDSQEWLSVQVHPDDEQAERLEGVGHLGKTEAWHILEADPNAQVVSGLKGDHSSTQLEELARSGRFEDVLAYVPVGPGDTLFTPAGCVHAIGPGLLIYEVQQTSDITYRLYDWNRPAAAGRALHLDKGLQVIGTCSGEPTRLPVVDGAERKVLTECVYFILEMIQGADRTVRLDTRRESFHALTVAAGEVDVRSGASSYKLGPLETILIPAALGAYELHPFQPFRLLLSRVP